MNFITGIFLFSIIMILIALFVVAPICELKKLQKNIEILPDGLWNIIKNPYKECDLLIEVKGSIDYSKNKMINANTKINYFKTIKEYCEQKINETLKEVGDD